MTSSPIMVGILKAWASFMSSLQRVPSSFTKESEWQPIMWNYYILDDLGSPMADHFKCSGQGGKEDLLLQWGLGCFSWSFLKTTNFKLLVI